MLKVLVVLIPLIVVPAEGLWDYFTYPKAISLWLLSFALVPYIVLRIVNSGRSLFSLSSFAVIAFVTVILISTLLSHYQSTVWTGQIHEHNGLLTYISYAIVFLVAHTMTGNKHDVLKLLVLSVSVVGLIGLLQYAGIFLWEPDGIRIYWKRMYSTIGNANWLSGAFTLALPLALYFESVEQKKLWWRVVIIVLSAALFANGTRGAYLGFFLVLLIWVVLHLKQRKVKTILLSTLFITVGFGLASIKNFYPIQRIISTQQNIQKGLSGDPSAGEHRLFIYQTSIPLILDNPVFGSGPDTFGKVYPQEEIDELLISEHGEFKNPMRRLNTAHNEYIQLAATIGLLGLGIFLYLLVLGILPIFNSGITLSHFLSMGVLAYAVHLLFTDASIGVASLFWIILGITLGLRQKQPVSS